MTCNPLFLKNLLRLSLSKVSTTKPDGFTPLFEVAGTFIEVGDEILLMHRHPDKPYGETWGIPAGKIEKGETPLEAAIREAAEETGIVFPGLPEQIGPLYVRLEDYDFTFHVFRITFDQKPEVLHEPDAHIDWIWIAPEQALAYPLIIGGHETFQYYIVKKREAKKS